METSLFLIEDAKKRHIFRMYKDEYEYIFIITFYCNTIITCIRNFYFPKFNYIRKVYNEIKIIYPDYKQNKYIQNSSRYVKAIVKMNLLQLYLCTFVCWIINSIGLSNFLKKVGN